MLSAEGDTQQSFQTLLDFFPERSPSKRNTFFTKICRDPLNKIIFVVRESGFVRMNTRNILKIIIIHFEQRTVM